MKKLVILMFLISSTQAFAGLVSNSELSSCKALGFYNDKYENIKSTINISDTSLNGCPSNLLVTPVRNPSIQRVLPLIEIGEKHCKYTDITTRQQGYIQGYDIICTKE